MTTPQASDASTRRLAAIMFADMVGYTALMQEDEQSAKTMRDRQKIVVESAVRDHLGEVIQWYGDGSLSIFGSALQAVRAAGNIQETLLTDPVVPLRIGLHLGDIMKDGEGIFGDGVNIASRIESLAVPGAVLWSDAIQSLIANQGDIKSVSLGEFKLKNVSRPVGVYAMA
ncbi:MAG: adenylate/guanylate cyclase domain-containing protein, partial [Saprospiraceae bacterium]|nr:adenylate/guanylate cyclase domain-containing protein [Saprospiraceae bacterium]